MKINTDAIKGILSSCLDSNDLFLYYCYANVEAVIGSLSTTEDKDYILGFTDKKLIILRLNVTGDMKNFTSINYENMRHVQVSKSFLGLKNIIKIYFSDDFKIILNMKKYVHGIKDQKENLKYIYSMFEKKFN